MLKEEFLKSFNQNHDNIMINTNNCLVVIPENSIDDIKNNNKKIIITYKINYSTGWITLLFDDIISIDTINDNFYINCKQLN